MVQLCLTFKVYFILFFVCFRFMGAGEMPPQLKSLAVLPEVPCWICSTHVVAHNCIQLEVQEIQCPLPAPVGTRNACGTQTYM